MFSPGEMERLSRILARAIAPLAGQAPPVPADTVVVFAANVAESLRGFVDRPRSRKLADNATMSHSKHPQLFNEAQLIRAARELIEVYGSHAAAVAEKRASHLDECGEMLTATR
jgi:hypothetical protein